MDAIFRKANTPEGDTLSPRRHAWPAFLTGSTLNPRRGTKDKKISTKAKKRYPRRATKDYEGPLRGWRKLKRDPPKVGKGEKISTKGDKGSVKRAKDESAKGFQGVGKDSKGIREGPRRTLRFSTNAHSIIEPISFLCTSFSSCLSCLSCVSMFNDAANRISETWPLLPIGIRTGCFTLE